MAAQQRFGLLVVTNVALLAGSAWAQSPSPTTTTLSSTPNPSFTSGANSVVTLTATVTSLGIPVIEGTVTVTDGGTPLAGCNGLSLSLVTGQASCTVSFTTEGSHSLAAAYGGTQNFATSQSTAVSQSVNNQTTNPGPGQYCNPGAIAIPRNGLTGSSTGDPSNPFPSNIYVSGLSGSLSNVTVLINGIAHPSVGDVEMLLVAPSGNMLDLWSNVAAGAAQNSPPASLVTLDDTAGSLLPATGGVVSSGTFLPTAYDTIANQFPSPAPLGFPFAAPFGSTTLYQAFNGANPNGTWQLFVADLSAGSTGVINGGWCLNFITSNLPAPTVSVTSSENPGFTGDSITISAAVSNAGAPVRQGTVTFSEGSNVLAGPLPLNAGGSASFAIGTLAEGLHTIKAAYNGLPGVLNTSSGTIAQEVDNHTTVQSSGNLTSYCNPNTGGLTISAASGNSPAVPYPSRVFVSNYSGPVSQLTVTLNGFSHNRPDDVESLLVGPAGTVGAALDYFSRVGNVSPVSAVNLTFADNAGAAIPAAGLIAPGSYLPTSGNGQDIFPPPAPIPAGGSAYQSAAPAGVFTFGSVYNNTNPNGTWSFYFVQNAGDGNQGAISGPICLNLYANPDLTVSESDSGSFTQGQSGSWRVTVHNAGPSNSTTSGAVTLSDTLPGGYVLNAFSGAGWSCPTGGNSFTCSTSSAIAGGGDFPVLTLTVNIPGNSPVSVTNTVTVGGGGEVNTGNDGVSDTAAVAQTPASLTVASGSGQRTPVNTLFSGLFKVTVNDGAGVPIPGVNVTFTAPASGPGGTFSGTASAIAATNASGVATAPAFTANGTSGSYQVTASVSGLVSTGAISLVNLAGPPVSVIASGGTPQSAPTGAAFKMRLHVNVYDANGNPVAGSTVTFSAPLSGPSGLFSGTSTIASAVTNASGYATAPTFAANSVAGGPYAVTATAGSATAAFSLTNTPSTVQALINTSPSGLSFIVDGQTFTTPQTVTWAVASKHTISTPMNQTAPGAKFTWQNWSDGGKLSHSVTAPASNISFTASFGAQYQLVTQVFPASGGTATGAGYYAAGTQAVVTATAKTGFAFAWFTGVTSPPQQNPGAVIMNGPVTVSASFAAQTPNAVLTYHNDSARTGQNLQETALTPANVTSAKFGKLFTAALDSWAPAQPLYMPHVTIGGATHNVVYVATLKNSVYAFDAGNGHLLWHNQYGSPSPFTNVCHDTNFQLAPGGGAGIVGTPVIDPTAKVMYFVTKTGTGTASSPFALKLHAVNIATGAQLPNSPVTINPNVPGVVYNPQYQFSRAGMLLSPGGDTVYVALGSTGCKNAANSPAVNNHGFMLSYQASTLTQTSAFVTTPNTNNGGIWQSGGGIAQDPAGSLYATTADAVFDADTPPDSDFGDSLLKLTPGLQLADYFTPSNASFLNNEDVDFGSGGEVIIDNNLPGALVPHLAVSSGKSADLFIVNRDNMGKFCASCSTNTNIVQQVTRPSDFGARLQCRWGAPAYFNSGGAAHTATGMVYFPGNSVAFMAYPITDGVVAAAPVRSAATYQAMGSPSISANGASNGIAWTVSRTFDNGQGVNKGTLSAFDAATLSLLYSSDQASAARDTLGSVAHFITPTVMNGKVYVATQTQLVVYGLLSGN
jgi:subtilisin-like proprotein convertase family protein